MLLLLYVGFHLPLGILFLSKGPITLTPPTTKAWTGMENGQAGAGDNDHSSLKNHKGNLVISERAVKATVQLRDTKDGTDKDRDRRHD